MADYFYNPLLREGLQKDSEVQPSDIQDIEEKITEINEDLKNKVPKFFASIEEIEVGEIGQYQGETNDTFMHGDFYERGSGAYSPVFSDPNEVSIIRRGRYVDDDNAGPYLYLLADSLSPESITTPNCLFTFPNPNATNRQIWCFVMPSNLAAQLNITGDIYINAGDLDSSWTRDMEGYLYPYVAIALGNGYYSIQPLKQEGSALYYCDNDTNSWIQIDYSSVNGRGNIQYENVYNANYFFEGKLVPCKYFNTNMGAFVILQNQSNIKQLLWYAAQAYPYESGLYYSFSENTDLYTLTWVVEASVIHVGFASLQQGEKADTALQSINRGKDGDYITTTVGAKDNNKNQSVGVSAKIQDISTADDDNKGILEASDAKTYIDKQIYDISQNFQFYGVQWDTSNPSPDCTRIGNMSLHAELPIQNSIVGGLLQDDLTFTPFPDQSDWSNETLDGSAGQVMARILPFYWKFETHGTINKVLLSEYPLPGYTKTPLIYVSTQKATVDRTDPNTPKLASVVNTTPEFRGGQNTANWDNTYRSLLGKPATNISLTDFRQYARNRGNGTAWNCHTYLAQRVLYWLFVTEYATLNSQKAFNAAKDANGYAQGGLGPGVSDWDDNTWLAYNNHNPLIPCGYMLEYGNQSAIKNYNVLDANGNTLHTFSVNSYRGIQSPFGDVWDWTDGILINVQSNAAGGVSTCYITDDPAKFSSTNFSQYTKLGNTSRADDWIKTIFNDEQGNIICKTQGGSSTSYYCDFYWGANLPASGVSLRGVRFGGSAIHGARCGFLCAASRNVPADVYPFIGSRLCAIPPP